VLEVLGVLQVELAVSSEAVVVRTVLEAMALVATALVVAVSR
jgi:hypothetical protein